MREAAAGLPDRVAHGAQESVAFVEHAPLERLGAAGERLAAAAEHAFVEAASAAMLVAAGVVLAAALYVAARAPRRAPAGSADRSAVAAVPLATR